MALIDICHENELLHGYVKVAIKIEILGPE